MDIPIIIITLPKSTERQGRISGRMDALNLPREFHHGVNGRAMSQDEIAIHYDHRKRLRKKHGYARPLTPSEVGCSLSHIGVYRRMVDENIPYALILEDDAIPGPSMAVVAEQLRHRFPANEPAAVFIDSHPQIFLALSRTVVATVPFGAYCQGFKDAWLFSYKGGRGEIG